MFHVPVPSQELWSYVCLCVFVLMLCYMYIFGTLRYEQYDFTYTRFIYLGRFRAFHKECDSTLVEGLVGTSRFVNFFILVDRVRSIWRLLHIFSFSYLLQSFSLVLCGVGKMIPRARVVCSSIFSGYGVDVR